jgi:hypothetical protein
MAEEGSTLNILAKSLQLVEKQIDSVTKSAAQLFSVAKGAGSTAASAVSVGVSNVMNLPPVRAGRLPGDTSGTVGGEPDGSNLMKKPPLKPIGPLSIRKGLDFGQCPSGE